MEEESERKWSVESQPPAASLPGLRATPPEQELHTDSSNPDFWLLYWRLMPLFIYSLIHDTSQIKEDKFRLWLKWKDCDSYQH